MKFKLLLIIFLSVHLNSFGQTEDFEDCYVIKYLDFFGLENEEIVKWPDSEIEGLMETDFEKDQKNPEVKTNFIIPLIIYQLKKYHPNCNSEIDTAYFHKISSLYLKIRGVDPVIVSDKSIAQKIDFMRRDFYRQMEDEKYLPKMMMTFDDGPFYGVDFDGSADLISIKTQKTDFGHLSVSKIDDKTVMTAKDNEGKILWQKSITGLYNRNLRELHFTKDPIEYNSVATITHMYSEGERFTLYLKQDGSFMYYFHSW